MVKTCKKKDLRGDIYKNLNDEYAIKPKTKIEIVL